MNPAIAHQAPIVGPKVPLRAVVIGCSVLCHALFIAAAVRWTAQPVEAPQPKTIAISMIAPPPKVIPPPKVEPPKAPPPRQPVPPKAAPPKSAMAPRKAAVVPPENAAPFTAAPNPVPAEHPATATPVATTPASVPTPAPAAATPDTEVSASPIGGKPLVYPPRMRDQEREGSVTFDCAIEADGKTADCKVLSVQGGDEFTDAALNYVQSARYRPATHNGASVRQLHHKIRVAFRLN